MPAPGANPPEKMGGIANGVMDAVTKPLDPRGIVGGITPGWGASFGIRAIAACRATV